MVIYDMIYMCPTKTYRNAKSITAVTTENGARKILKRCDLFSVDGITEIAPKNLLKRLLQTGKGIITSNNLHFASIQEKYHNAPVAVKEPMSFLPLTT